MKNIDLLNKIIKVVLCVSFVTSPVYAEQDHVAESQELVDESHQKVKDAVDGLLRDQARSMMLDIIQFNTIKGDAPSLKGLLDRVKEKTGEYNQLRKKYKKGFASIEDLEREGAIKMVEDMINELDLYLGDLNATNGASINNILDQIENAQFWKRRFTNSWSKFKNNCTHGTSLTLVQMGFPPDYNPLPDPKSFVPEVNGLQVGATFSAGVGENAGVSAGFMVDATGDHAGRLDLKASAGLKVTDDIGIGLSGDYQVKGPKEGKGGYSVGIKANFVETEGGDTAGLQLSVDNKGKIDLKTSFKQADVTEGVDGEFSINWNTEDGSFSGSAGATAKDAVGGADIGGSVTVDKDWKATVAGKVEVDNKPTNSKEGEAENIHSGSATIQVNTGNGKISASAQAGTSNIDGTGSGAQATANITEGGKLTGSATGKLETGGQQTSITANLDEDGKGSYAAEAKVDVTDEVSVSGKATVGKDGKVASTEASVNYVETQTEAEEDQGKTPTQLGAGYKASKNEDGSTNSSAILTTGGVAKINVDGQEGEIEGTVTTEYNIETGELIVSPKLKDEKIQAKDKPEPPKTADHSQLAGQGLGSQVEEEVKTYVNLTEGEIPALPKLTFDNESTNKLGRSIPQAAGVGPSVIIRLSDAPITGDSKTDTLITGAFDAAMLTGNILLKTPLAPIGAVIIAGMAQIAVMLDQISINKLTKQFVARLTAKQLILDGHASADDFVDYYKDACKPLMETMNPFMIAMQNVLDNPGDGQAVLDIHSLNDDYTEKIKGFKNEFEEKMVALQNAHKKDASQNLTQTEEYKQFEEFFLGLEPEQIANYMAYMMSSAFPWIINSISSSAIAYNKIIVNGNYSPYSKTKKVIAMKTALRAELRFLKEGLKSRDFRKVTNKLVEGTQGYVLARDVYSEFLDSYNALFRGLFLGEITIDRMREERDYFASYYETEISVATAPKFLQRFFKKKIKLLDGMIDMKESSLALEGAQ